MLQQGRCHVAPLYRLGPLATDIAPGYAPHHLRNRNGHHRHALHRDALPRRRQGARRVGQPCDDVKTGMITYKQRSAHAADMAKGHQGAGDWDDTQKGTVRVPVAQSVRAVPGPEHRRGLPRRDPLRRSERT